MREGLMREGLMREGPMRILIIGAGAIGSLLGARLALSGQQVTLVGRPALAEAVRAGGLTLEEPTADGATTARHAANVSAVTSIAEAFTGGAGFDLALITVKAYDTANIIAELAAAGASAPLPALLTLQNGVGNEEALAAAFGASRILTGAIDTPVSVPAPGHVRVHRPAYRIGLAAVAAVAPILAGADTALTGAGFAVTRYADYRGLKWTKLLMNMLANASCAILDWTPAQVMAHPLTARLEAIAWQEALAVMAAQNIRGVALGGYPFPLILPLARRLPAAWLGRALRSFVSGGRGSKMPSLHIALANHQRLEVDWLNGAVARAAATAHLPAPVNAAYTALLTALATDEALRDAYRHQPKVLAEYVARHRPTIS
jgi:2-dehydropantoate 2-reductase